MNQLARAIIDSLRRRSLKLVLAESCTAGLAASNLAAIPGASDVFWGGYVTYSAAAKEAMLGVPACLIERYGAVSRETACAMAAGALGKSGADIAAAVTGLAGPGSDTNPPALPPARIGDVWIAVCVKGGESAAPAVALPAAARLYHFTGNRATIRRRAARALLERLLAEGEVVTV